MFLHDFCAQTPHIIAVYIDILCLHLSQLTHSGLALVTATALADLIQTTGHQMTAPEWDALTQSLCLCFDATLPIQLRE
jgi:hypothetical protein